MNQPTDNELEDILLSLVHEISSMRVGKTFNPMNYINPAIAAIQTAVLAVLEENKWCDGMEDTNTAGVWKKTYSVHLPEATIAIKQLFESKEPNHE